ncbi:MAG: poly(A) polymerase [Paracoccaceae bacterium]|jgi:poly(A) polymerase
MSQITLKQDWLQAEPTQKLCRSFAAQGFEIYFVGGVVRNALLGCETSDLDLATDARPQDVIDLARACGFKATPTGIDHGTVTVVASSIVHEITTFRRDVKTDGRHAVVEFSTNLIEDAKRRDFTMNALYADAEGHVIDPLGGLDDLMVGRVVFVGDAVARIQEDHLRILRFFRFYALYADPAGGIDPQALAACSANIEGVNALPAERIGAEMRKLLLAQNPSPAVAAMQTAGVLAKILPGADAKALAPLVHLEDGSNPDFLRRLVILGGPLDAPRLRLTRRELRTLALLRQEIGLATSACDLAYRHGADVAYSVLLCRSALFETSLPSDMLDDLALGASATFPLSAADLDPALRGPMIGAQLKDLENQWIASGFCLSKEALLRLA